LLGSGIALFRVGSQETEAELLRARTIFNRAFLESSGATEWFFADFVEQWRSQKVDRVVAERESEHGKRQQVAEIIADLLKVGGAGARGVVAVLPWSLSWDFPLTADGLDVAVADEVHGKEDLFGARRKEILL
jgi:hypothetical protein